MSNVQGQQHADRDFDEGNGTSQPTGNGERGSIREPRRPSELGGAGSGEGRAGNCAAN